MENLAQAPQQTASLLVRCARRSVPPLGSHWRRECHIAGKNATALAGRRGTVYADRPFLVLRFSAYADELMVPEHFHKGMFGEAKYGQQCQPPE